MAIFCMRCYVRRSDSQPRWLFIFSPCHRFVEWENIGYRLSFKQSLLALLLRWFMYALASISNSISAQPNISKLKSTETIGQYVNFPCSYWTNWTERESILTVRWKQEKKLNINFARPIIQRACTVGIRYGGIEINKTQWDVKGNKFEWKRVPNLIGNLSPERDDSHKERKKKWIAILFIKFNLLNTKFMIHLGNCGVLLPRQSFPRFAHVPISLNFAYFRVPSLIHSVTLSFFISCFSVYHCNRSIKLNRVNICPFLAKENALHQRTFISHVKRSSIRFILILLSGSEFDTCHVKWYRIITHTPCLMDDWNTISIINFWFVGIFVCGQNYTIKCLYRLGHTFALGFCIQNH